MTGKLETGWEPFLSWADRFRDPGKFDFEGEEREYKLLAVEPLKEARAQLASSEEWVSALKRGFTNPRNNLVSRFSYRPFLDWVAANPEDAAAALSALWSKADDTPGERLDAFDALLPLEALSGGGVRCNLGAYLLGAVDPLEWPSYRITTFRLAFELTRTPLPDAKSSLGDRYEHALSFLDDLRGRLEATGPKLRDRLDAQGIMWCVVGWAGDKRPENFSPEEWEELLLFRAVPVAMRQNKDASQRASKPKPVASPPRQVCRLCGDDDEVSLIGRADDRWVFVCEAAARHPDAEPYEFTAT